MPVDAAILPGPSPSASIATKPILAFSATFETASQAKPFPAGQ
jgi:hypothetical protein